jgi:hypothetical protein
MKMSSLFARITFVSLVVMCSGCVTTEQSYSSGQDGAVDCKDFRIQSSRDDMKPATEKSCWIATANTVQHVATGYGRHFESGTGFMNTLLYAAGTHTYILHRDTQALLVDFPQVKKEATGWEELPPVEANGRRFKLQKFSLNESKQDCIGYAAYGNSVYNGYNSILSGYSCKFRNQGKMQIPDIQKDLDALRVRM